MTDNEKGRVVAADVGTMFFQTAELGQNNAINIKTIRNAFVELADLDDIEDILKQNKWQYVRDGEHYYVIGEDSLRVARMFPGKVELRRPMQDGVLNKGEEKKMLVLAELIESSIGKATGEDSLVCTCVSSESVDGSSDSTFHKARLTGMFKRLGWNVKVIEEGLAVVLSERPVIKEADGTESPYSGIGLSCLVPGTKIYTDHGILNIENVKAGYKVLTHMGRWRNINNVITKEFDGSMTKIQVVGFSNTTEEYKFVDNHEIYIKKDGEWKWVGCEDVDEGDIVGEPIIQPDREKYGFIGMTICERTTCSNTYKKTRIDATSDVQRLIGYFLGDGYVLRKSNKGIGFDFGLNEEGYVKDIVEILEKNFGKPSSISYHEKEGESKRIRVNCHSIGLGNYFRNHFYDENGEKKYPYDISRLSKGQCLNLLVGMIRSDGWVNGESVVFGTTSTNLAILAKQLFSRVGLPASISYREPREHILQDGRVITGKKDEWQIISGGKLTSTSLQDMIEKTNCSNSMFSEKIFIDGYFCCSPIQKIETEEYLGLVYDLQVEEDHSFSGPFMTIHNCGAGRVNCVLAYKGLPIIGMSVSKAGDFIDKQVSIQTDTPISQVAYKKEKELDFTNIDEEDDVLFALDAYYGVMIEFVFDKFAKKFAEVKSQFDAPLDIIVAGGTSMPKGFCEKVEKVIKEMNLPFKINEVKRASDPRNAVVKGCLTQALISQKKLKESKKLNEMLGDS